MSPPSQSAAPEQAAATTEPPVQEVRVAMALNGGVSLAVWMGGCAVELDRARRANAPADETPRIYDALCECFGRHLVIDILTGASAGGINGALLGAAMVSGRKLDAKFVRDQWLDLGNLSDLLYPSTMDNPPALLNGQLFYDRLLETFKGLLGVDPEAPGHEECATNGAVLPLVPSLDVTMTDVVGVEKRFRDAWGGELVAREHRPRFKFREAAHFNAEALATAARTSASFPVAFEPWPVKGDPRVLAGLPNPTFGIDGGLLDNAPIKAALDLIPSKSANSRVLRYVCYLNGDPVMPSDEMAGASPDLRAVGGYTINLPRVAPFVDQLYAIKRAVERPRLAERVQLRLLGIDIKELQGVALALFTAYQDRRTVESLEELLGDPGAASAMNELLRRTEGHLPWIPLGLGSRPTDTWRWGIRPAQRILHLLLDLLRAEIRATSGSLHNDLVQARDKIAKQLTLLGDAREQVIALEHENDPASFTEETPLDRLQKAVTKALAQAPKAQKAVETAAEAFRELVLSYPEHFGARPTFRVFYEPPPGDSDWFSTFLLRVLSIEVVRRAFSTEAEIESAEELRFVQLTPAAPSPIFTAGPLSLRSPATAADKLAGVGLGHFAGFYRRSWRANDFMWGRLDAAARIVDLLLDRPSDDVGRFRSLDTSSQAEARSTFLINALLPEDLPEDAKPDLEARRTLLQEALEDATAIGSSSPGEKLQANVLKPLVQGVIKEELVAASTQGSGVNRMPFTRAVFQRAAQLEIVADELPLIREETVKDSKLGSAVLPFPPEDEGDEGENLISEVRAVRELYQKGGSLPGRLTDSEEVVSDLGLRTITHAAFVALAAVRTAKAPLSKFFGIVRTPLSAVAATVAQGRLYRLVAGIGFWAAAVYLTSRLVTANPHGHLEFSAVWSWQALTALVAALAALGIAAVPILRLWRGVKPLRNFLLAVALLGAAFGFSAALSAIFGEFNLTRILFTPGASTPPDIVLLAPLVVLGAVSAARLPIPGWLNPLTGAITAIRQSRLVYLLAAATFLLLGIWAGVGLYEAGFDGGAFWQACSAVLALLVAPIVATMSLARWPHHILARLRRAF
jgi:predicted acylesterase/phospholipase RssA